MSDGEESDVALLRRFQRGDDAAFEAIVRRFQDRVFRLSCLWLYESANADDAAQEVFLRAYRGLRGFRFRAEPFTWLYRTTRNVCREFNRRQRPETLPDDIADTAEPIDEILDRAAVSRRVRDFVAALPERQREVVWLRLFEQCSVEETARTMGCREGTVKALLHKATARLRIRMKGEDR